MNHDFDGTSVAIAGDIEGRFRFSNVEVVSDQFLDIDGSISYHSQGSGIAIRKKKYEINFWKFSINIEHLLITVAENSANINLFHKSID